jgi:hypothetical protein
MKNFSYLFKSLAILSLFVLSAFVELHAAQEKISAQVNPKTASVGDIIKFSVKVQLPEGAYVGATQEISFKDFDIINSEILKLNSQKNSYELNFYICAYKTGSLTINPAPIFYIDADGNDNLFFTPQETVNIKSVIGANTVVTDIKDIKTPVRLKIKPIYGFFITIVLIGFLISAIFLVKNIIENSKKAKIVELDNRTKALIDLEELYNESFKITVKVFYYRMSEILRTYISKTYKFDAMEMTTSEFFDKVKGLLPSEIDIAEFKQYLQVFNLARYADWIPTKEEIENNYSITKKLLELL